MIAEIKKDTLFYDESNGGITFSGGEPLIKLDFLLALLQSCKESDIHTAVDTCGYAPLHDFQKIIHFVDLFLYDVKIWDEKLHQKYTGVSNRLIHDNLKYLSEGSCRIIIRIPLIPRIVDIEDNITKLIDFISGLKNIVQINLLPYNKIGESKYEKLGRPFLMGEIEIQTDEKIEQLTQLFSKTGFPLIKG